MKSKINIQNLRPEDQLILTCLQHQHSLPKLDFDEERLIQRMAYHRVTSMIYQHLLKIDRLNVLSVETQAELKKHYYLNLAHNLAISHLVKQISKVLTINNIKTVLLKGAMLLQAFPDYVLIREMVDLDIMVKSKKLDEAVKILSKAGFEDLEDFCVKNKVKQWYFQHRSNAVSLQSERLDIPPVLVELHWQLFTVLNHTNWSEKDLWSRTNYCFEQEVYHLDPVDTLLHICAHQCNGLQIYLYGLVDVDTILKAWSDNLDWREVIHRAKSRRVLLHLVNILRLCQDLLNTPLPDVYFTELKSYELRAKPGYDFLFERLFYKEHSEDGRQLLSLIKVFRRLEYSNLWQRFWCEVKLLTPFRLRLN